MNLLSATLAHVIDGKNTRYVELRANTNSEVSSVSKYIRDSSNKIDTATIRVPALDGYFIT